MQGGHNKASKATKKLRGTERKSREAPARAVAMPGNVGEPPVHLSNEEKHSWAKLAPAVAGVFTESDRPTFELLVELHARLRDPSLPPTAFASIATRVSRMLEAFGCSPRSRKFVEPGGMATAPKDGTPADDDEAFLFHGKPKLKAVT